MKIVVRDVAKESCRRYLTGHLPQIAGKSTGYWLGAYLQKKTYKCVTHMNSARDVAKESCRPYRVEKMHRMS